MFIRKCYAAHQLKKFRSAQAVLLIGISVAALIYPKNSLGASACLSQDVEAKLKQREIALLGPGHADQHAEVRGHRCKLEKGLARVTVPSVGALSQAANIVGQWSSPFVIPVAGITSVLLNNGKVLFWAYDPADWGNPLASNTGVAYVWNPVSRTGHSLTPPENIWCGGQTILSDGRVFIAGGNLRYPDPPPGTLGWEGSLSAYTFNPNIETWTRQPDMSSGRWYPTVTQLADNRAVITSGLDQTGTNIITQTVDLFTPAGNINKQGTMSRVTDHYPVGLYPFQYLMLSAQMLQAGPYLGNTVLLTPNSWSWSDIPNLNISHFCLGNGIIYTDASVTPTAQVIMIAGGCDPNGGNTTISSNEWLDGNNPTAGWQSYPQWQQTRHNSNTIILPDGTLFTVGGNSEATSYDGPLNESELYNKPANDLTGTWVQMAPNTIQAAYHSSALLLPNATVLLSQDDMGNTNGSLDTFVNHQWEVYSPPYLFKGSRPQITRAPNAVTWGQTFQVSVNVSTGRVISRAALIAPGAVTHANDMHQRFVKVAFGASGTNLNVTIPASRALVPPGYYMLFIVDSMGVPSVARFVRVS